MKITVLGNCATQTKEHETTSFVVDVNEKKILIDCGISTVRQLQCADISFLDISAIVLTHCHADHIAGYPYLLFSIDLARKLSADRKFDNIPVIALNSVLQGITQTLDIQYPVEKLGEGLVDLYAVNDDCESLLEVGEVLIKTFPTHHSVPSIGVKIEYEDTSISFSGDTVYDKNMLKYIGGSKVLIHEAFCLEDSIDIAKQTGHSTAREAGMIARDANVKKLVLCHPLAVIWKEPSSLMDEAKKEFKGEVILPKELDIIYV